MGHLGGTQPFITKKETNSSFIGAYLGAPYKFAYLCKTKKSILKFYLQSFTNLYRLYCQELTQRLCL